MKVSNLSNASRILPARAFIPLRGQIKGARGLTAGAARMIWCGGLLFLAALPALVHAQHVPVYETSFSHADGFTTGGLDGQGNWLVDEGEAVVEADGISSSERSVVLRPGEPPTQISRDFTQYSEADVVFIDFRIRGGAGKPPTNAPEASAPDAFYIALAADEGVGRIYVLDGDRAGGGTWRKAEVAIPLDENQRTISGISLTVRMDFARKSFDLFVDGSLAGFDYGLLNEGQQKFSRFVLRGNPEVEIYLERFYAGTTPLRWENQSGDGLSDEWKMIHSLDLNRDVRDEDADRDGLSNIEEFFLGTSPSDADTSQDGLSDSEAIERTVDPLRPSNLFPVSLPVFDDFERWPLGDIHARGGWQVSGAGSVGITGEVAFRGNRGLLLDSAGRNVALQLDVSENQESIVWTDFYMEVARYARSAAPDISDGTAVALYFDGEGRPVGWDGLAGEWRTFESVALPEKPGWARVTIRQDFDEQTWSLWVDSVRVAQGLGFGAQRPSFTRLRVAQPKTTTSIDEVYIGVSEPHFLDDDGDGLTNAEEFERGTDPGNPDTSNDGMWDGNKVDWNLEPTEPDNFARLVNDEEGVLSWTSGFEADEGFPGGSIAGQGDWLVTPGAGITTERVYDGQQALAIAAAAAHETPHRAELFIGAGNEQTVWVTMHVRPQAGRLPDPTALAGPRSALLAVNVGGHLFGYDGRHQRWVNSHVRLGSPEEWVRLDVMLDYQKSRYWVCIDGVLVLRDLGFRDQGLRTLTRFALQGASGEKPGSTGLDAMTIGVDEPLGLDFSGDGLTNDEKRALGLDVFKVDTTGDGLPDWWLVKHGLDATDPEVGAVDTESGLTVRQAFLLGTRPDLFDTDGDGWGDFDEYLAGTDPVKSDSVPDEDGLKDWTVASVGEGLDPYAYRVEGEYRLLGSGRGTERNEDGFTFVYQTVSGNFEAVAHVEAPEHLELGPDGLPSWLSQNGLMARPTLDSTAPYAAIFSAPYWYWSRFRELPGSRAMGLTHEPVIAGDSKYIRMRRVGNRFRHYLSDDGETWFLASDIAVTMPEEILVGMFASAHSENLWVRARLGELEINKLPDQVEWHSDPGKTNAFDSFAWMGEWDGGEEYDEPSLSIRQPTLQELHAAGMQTPNVFDLSGSHAANTTGAWETDGSSLVALERRGWIEFDLEVTDPDVFLIELEARENNSSRRTVSSFHLKFYLEDDYLGTRVLEATADDSGTVHVFSPWLETGTHRVRIFWDGARSRSFLEVDSVRLRAIDGVDTSGDGIKDWVVDRLLRQTGAQPHPQSFTHVSPLPVEGHSRFNGRMWVENVPVLSGGAGAYRNVARPFTEHPRGSLGHDVERSRSGLSPVGGSRSVPDDSHLLPTNPRVLSEYLSAWADPVRFRGKRGPGHRFWVDVPLAPFVDNAVTLSWQDGVAEQRHMVRWIPYNLLQGGSMVLRVGDSIMVTAHHGDQQSGEVFLEIRQESFETAPGSPLVYTFSEVGDYIFEGTYRHENGQEFSGALHVSVRDFTFEDRPLAYVGRERVWKPGGDLEQSHSPDFEADPRLSLRSFDEVTRFGSNNNVLKTVAARVPESGVILGSVEAESFRLFSSWETYATVIETLPDGSELIEMMMILSPVPEDVRILKEILVGGVLFDDGTLERWLLPEDFDEQGQVTFRFIMPEEAKSSACHRTLVYQNDVLLGIR